MSFSTSTYSSILQSFTIKLPLRRHHWAAESFLTCVNTSSQFLEANRKLFLHTSELEVYQKIQYPQKRQQYLQGRYVAKKNLAHRTGEQDLTRLITHSGVFQQPLISYANQEMPTISIAHSGSLAVCLSFPREHPMGLDIEPVHMSMSSLVANQLTAHEKALYQQESEDFDHFCTRLWVIKESLGKTLTTGLTTPLWLYEVQEIHEYPQYKVSLFTHFTQYKALSFLYMGCIWAIVLPRNTDHLPLIKQLLGTNETSSSRKNTIKILN